MAIKPFKFRYVNEITGAFVLLGVVVLIMAVYLMGRSKNWFIRHERFSILLPETGSMGLRPGGDVRILQTSVGTVEDISLPDPNGRMRAQVSVRSDFAGLVRGGSRATVRSTVIGDPYIEITKGAGEKLEPGSVIEAQADRSPADVLQETIEEIRKEIVPAVREAGDAFKEYGDLAADLRKPESELQQAFKKMNNVAGAVERGEGLAGKILTDPQMAAEVQATLPKVNRILDETEAVVKNVNKTTGAISGHTEKTLQEIQALLDDIRKTTATLPKTADAVSSTAETLPGLVLQMQETMRQLQKLVEQMQRSWLLGGGGGAPPDAGRRIRPEDIGS